MQLKDAAGTYLLYRESHGARANTLRNYRRMFNRLEAALGNISMADFDFLAADAWARSAADLCDAAFNNERSCLASFLRWCRAREINRYGSALTDAMPIRKIRSKERNRVPMADFPALLDAAEHPRDRMIVALGLFLFLRASEAVTLRISDVDLDSGEIAVNIHKTGDYDIMPISKELDTELRRWLTYYSNECGSLKPDWYLVPAKVAPTYGRAGAPQAPDGFAALSPTRPVGSAYLHVSGVLRAFGWSISGEDREGMHTLRRSGARAYYDTLADAGVDGALRRVMTMLHHASVTTTERYLGLTVDRAVRDKEVKGQSMYPALETVSKLHVVNG